MQNLAIASVQTEPEFAALVDTLTADPHRRKQLTELLREDHPIYDQRGTATTVRMRGWVLLALARAGVADDCLLFVLDELDTGVDAYLVAAAARALRSHPNPSAAFAPFLMRALTNIRYHDEFVSFDSYGDYATFSTDTSAVRELLATLTWLGPLARGVLNEIEPLRAQRGGLSRKLHGDLDRAVDAIRGGEQPDKTAADACCRLPNGLSGMFSWAPNSRRRCESIASTIFEDHEGGLINFKEFFQGQPSIVVFFYTRCDNPLKCSLTVTKFARVQKLLESQGFAEQIHTAAITYDPAYDLAERIRGYGQNRGVRMDQGHRMLRATDGIDTLRSHFKLGVNFIESLVNRHRVEAYVLDHEGGIAASFQRIHWNEQEVVQCAIGVLKEKDKQRQNEFTSKPTSLATRPKNSAQLVGTLASVGVAFFPKCPICWAGYMSVFGIASLEQIPYSPWLQPLLVAVMLINLASVWLRGRATGRMSGFCLASIGALAIILSRAEIGWEKAAAWGVVLTLAGSLLSALNSRNDRLLAPD